MRGLLRRIVREHGGVSMAVVDYIQLMDANKANASNRNLELTAISRDIKRMAMDFNMPFIAISQLTKDVEKAKRRPRMATSASPGHRPGYRFDYDGSPAREIRRRAEPGKHRQR